jgi:hypothetical protein
MFVRRWAWAALAVALVTSRARSEELRVSAGTVEDTRPTDPRFGGMSIELKLTGDGVADVKALRVKVKSAKDDKGTVLFKPDPEKKPKDFEEFSVDRQPKPKLSLLSPARGASTVDVAGEVELFIPKRDPGTEQKVEKFLTKIDKPIANPALKSAKVEVTPLSADEYKKRNAKNKPTKEQVVAEGKKHGASDKEIEEAWKLMEALSAIGGGDEPDEKSVVFEVKDPDGRMLGIDLVDKEGKVVSAVMRSSSGGLEAKMMKLSFSEKPAADATLLVTVRTSKSVVTIPLELKGVALP